MINTFFDQLVDHLKSDLPWLDRVGGNVSYRKGQNGKFYPVSCFDDECAKNAGYLLPGAGACNVLFFELKKSSKRLDDPCTEVNAVEFDLFFWFNCELHDVKVNGEDIGCCEKIDFLYNEIVKSLNKFGSFRIFGVNYNISSQFIDDDCRFYPNFNFKISLGTSVTFSPCEYSNIDIEVKKC